MPCNKGCQESVKRDVARWLAEGALEHAGVGSSGGLGMQIWAGN